MGSRTLFAFVSVLMAGCEPVDRQMPPGPDALAGPGQLAISPAFQDFGMLEVRGRPGRSFDFTIRNVGSGPLGVPSISIIGGDFNQRADCVTPLSSGDRCTSSVTFVPTVRGARSAILSVAAVGAETVTAALTGVGVGGLSVTPAAHDFGPIVVGASSDGFTWRVANDGAVALEGLTVSLLSDSFALTTGNACSARSSLAPGENCTLEIVFRPLTRGPRTAELVVRAGERSVTSTLAGVGLHGPRLVIHPIIAQFSAQAGTPGSPVDFAVANAGDGDTGAISFMLGGRDGGSFELTSQFCAGPLVTAAVCQFGVRVKATTAGEKLATLTVSSAAGGMAVATLTAVVSDADAGAPLDGASGG